VALRRIQELTNEGVNLEGVKRIMALEVELIAAKDAFSALASEARANVEQTRREFGRDLVPVQNALSLIIKPSRRPRGTR